MQIRWKELSLENWERKNTYLGFRDFDIPYMSIGADLDLGPSYSLWKEAGISPYLAIVYSVCRTANSIAAFRQRIRDSQLIEHEVVHADFTVPEGENSFTVRLVPYSENFSQFYSEAATNGRTGAMNVSPGIGSSQEYDHWIYMSCLPWIRFTHLTQPVTRQSGSIPRIVWGKIAEENGKWIVPFSVMAHHSLVDGLHVSQFYKGLETLWKTPESIFNLK